jgi:F-type H+-transporting ATPase subunit b
VLIDWFTVGAQALNFLILAWLLKRLLYRPILDAIEARQQRIAAQLAAADAGVAQARSEREEFHRRREQLDGQRAALLSQATEEAKREAQRLLEQARQAADALRERRREALRNEAESLNQEICRGVQREVFAIARKTLADLASTSLEERMVGQFIRRLREMDSPANAALIAELCASSEPTPLRSAFDLSPAQRVALQQALDEFCGAPVRLRFETAPELVSGIELSTSGQKLGWSIAEYLRGLEREVGALLAAQAAAASSAGSPAAQAGPGRVDADAA